MYIGIDNLNVLHFAAKVLNETEWVKPLPLHKDGDLIAYIYGILEERGRPTVKVAKVKGHASDEMVAVGSVRRQDKDDNGSCGRGC